ncbi:MAG: DUF4404 family protein [Steroidobacteraceae bacterium]
MSQEELRELLRRVHEQLSRAPSVDEDTRRLLMKVTDDIERAVGASAMRAEIRHESLPRLETLAVRFEVEHPALGQGLRQLIDFLVKGGV